jgi:hypothetical protein
MWRVFRPKDKDKNTYVTDEETGIFRFGGDDIVDWVLV